MSVFGGRICCISQLGVYATFFFCLFYGILGTPLLACPGLLALHTIPLINRAKIQHNQIQLFTFDTSKPNAWLVQPVQIDPLDSEGNMVFSVSQDWDREFLRPHDRLSFKPQNFGRRYDGKSRLPCGTTQLVELDFKDKFGYLAVCQPNDRIPTLPSPVSLDETSRIVSAPFYRYHYSERNHLVFDNIELADQEFKTYSSVAKDSDLLIVGDVRNFFTLYFDADNIDAFISQKKFGPMGLMGGLKFYLKILYFQIQMSLTPELNFFDDSLLIPMTMTLPVNAKKYLRPGSGIYYTWASGDETEWLWEKSQLEELNLAVLDPSNKNESARFSDRYCDANLCRYSLLGRARGRVFSLHFDISRKAAELGFFPRLIRDVPAVEKQLKHSISRFSAMSRVGLYFETSRLPEGEHTWKFWIHFPQDLQDSCDLSVKSRSWATLLKILDKK